MKNIEKDFFLGKQVPYKYKYDPTLLQSVSRQFNRDEIKIDQLGFHGFDCWNLYELSWLNEDGMPQVAIGEVYIPCISPNLVESKSFKLYLNSFSQTKFSCWDEVKGMISNDLTICAGLSVDVVLWKLDEAPHGGIYNFDGICLDDQKLIIDNYSLSSNFLHNSVVGDEIGHYRLHSHLLKSNCLITHQPDWGSIYLDYVGKEISKENILRYLISFRMHNEFHEQCVERIFVDLTRICEIETLSVYARYTRRGGLDINPYRSTNPITLDEMKDMNRRLVRQ